MACGLTSYVLNEYVCLPAAKHIHLIHILSTRKTFTMGIKEYKK